MHGSAIYRYFLTLNLIGIAIFANAQNNLSILDSLSGSVMRAVHNQSEEKVLLVSNKRFYQVNESIWYRVFLVHSISGRISTKSKVLYVDLVNSEDKPLARAMLNAGRQQTSGTISVPDSIPSGNYWLRAYTRRIASGDSLNCAVNSLYIYNPKAPRPEHNSSVEVVPTAPVIDIYPEGGSLITATENLVALYAHDRKGNALPLRAFLVDNLSKDTMAVTTDAYGLGSFSFSPNKYKHYSLITSYNGSLYRFALPPYDFWGGRVSVRQGPEHTLDIRTVLEDSLTKNNPTTYLIAVRGDSLCYAGVGSGSYETTVAAANLPDGIIRFYLYNYQLKLLSERTVYVHQGEVNIQIETDKSHYKPREDGLLRCAVTDGKNNPVIASLCIKVLDSTAEKMSEEVERDEQLQQVKSRGLDAWAAIQLRGLTDQQLDELLLCKPALAMPVRLGSSHLDLVEDDLPAIRGQVLSQKGVPLANRPITLISNAANGTALSDSTDGHGRFSISVPELMDSTPFYLQVGGSHGIVTNVTVTIDTSAFPSFSTPKQLKYAILLTATRLVRFASSHRDASITDREQMLNPVVLKTTLRKPLDYDEKDRISTYSRVVSPTMIHRAGTGFMENAIRMAPGLQIIQGFVLIGGINAMHGPDAKMEPLVLMDGVEVHLPVPQTPNVSPVLQYFSELGANEVDFIEILTGAEAALYGLRGGNGVIYIHSPKKIFDADLPAKNGLVKFYTKGFTREAAFRQSNFKLSEFASASADQRSTLLWEGNVLNDARGTVQTSFTASDIRGTYVVVVTGITVHGALIYGRSKLVVQ